MTVHQRVRALFVSLALGGALCAALPAVTASAAPSFSPRAAAPVGVHVAPSRTAAAAEGTGAAAAEGTGLSWLMLPSQRTLVVDVVDKTGDAWPVQAASSGWATAHVRYAYVSSCRAGVPCVVVREGSYGRTGWNGMTTAVAGQMFTFTSPVQIQLNDSYGLSASEHRAVTCHELGHALGLDHDNRASSCLQPVAQAAGPDSLDRAQLEQLYAPTG